MVVVVVLVVVVEVVVVVLVVVPADTPPDAVCTLIRILFEAVNPFASVAVTVTVCVPVSRNVSSGLSPVAVFCVLGPTVTQVRVIGSVPPEDCALNVASGV